MKKLIVFLIMGITFNLFAQQNQIGKDTIIKSELIGMPRFSLKMNRIKELNFLILPLFKPKTDCCTSPTPGTVN
jgi:hypothetical protein